jgi:DNA-binding winged helix-turn-helix (wHTH) protein
MSAKPSLVHAPLPAPSGDCYVFGSFAINARNRMLFRHDVVVPLTIKSFDTLFILVQNAGNVVPKSQLLDQVWAGLFVEEGSVTQNICILRRLLTEGGIPNAIETLPKRGYRFIAKVRLENKDAEILIESPPVAPSPDSVEVEVPELEGNLAIDSTADCRSWGSDRSARIRRTLSFGPFRNLSRDAESDWIGEALKEMLSMESGLGSGQRTNGGEPPNDLSIGGWFLSVGGQIKVGLKVQETATGRVLETVTLRKKQEELLDLIEILGQRIRTAVNS